MTGKTGQLISCGPGTWRARVSLGREPEPLASGPRGRRSKSGRPDLITFVAGSYSTAFIQANFWRASTKTV